MEVKLAAHIKGALRAQLSYNQAMQLNLKNKAMKELLREKYQQLMSKKDACAEVLMAALRGVVRTH